MKKSELLISLQLNCDLILMNVCWLFQMSSGHTLRNYVSPHLAPVKTNLSEDRIEEVGKRIDLTGYWWEWRTLAVETFSSLLFLFLSFSLCSSLHFFLMFTFWEEKKKKKKKETTNSEIMFVAIYKKIKTKPSHLIERISISSWNCTLPSSSVTSSLMNSFFFETPSKITWKYGSFYWFFFLLLFCFSIFLRVWNVLDISFLDSQLLIE